MSDKAWRSLTSSLSILCLLLLLTTNLHVPVNVTSPIINPLQPLQPLASSKKGYDVFGYAPYWTFDKLNTVDFSTLTTFAYFGVPVDSYGDLEQDDPGYTTFESDQATQIFKKAHSFGTSVLLTVTQMDNATIESFLDSDTAQTNAIANITAAVKARGIDGINVDFEYIGDPGYYYRNRFSTFIAHLTQAMHEQSPTSQVTIAVYASAAKPGEEKLYDIAALGKTVDRVFMMAYDFAVAGSDYAEPTAPLYGYKQGKYSYDVSTAVKDFLRLMPADKLILGVPYYGYSYVTYAAAPGSETRPDWCGCGTSTAQTYDFALANDSLQADGVDGYKSGWDPIGEVGWKAYHDAYNDTWRVIYLEDTRSLGLKYDFAKSENLAGVGIWALGFDDGHTELWSLLRQKFGTKLAFTSINTALNNTN